MSRLAHVSDGIRKGEEHMHMQSRQDSWCVYVVYIEGNILRVGTKGRV